MLATEGRQYAITVSKRRQIGNEGNWRISLVKNFVNDSGPISRFPLRFLFGVSDYGIDMRDRCVTGRTITESRSESWIEPV